MNTNIILSALISKCARVIVQVLLCSSIFLLLLENYLCITTIEPKQQINTYLLRN